MNPHPQWFISEIADGLQRLMVLSLSGTPAAETITATAMVWCDAVRMGGSFRGELVQARDVPRLRTAFQWLVCEADRWPAPRQLIERLPSLPPLVELPPPPKLLTPEERARVATMLQRLLMSRKEGGEL